MEFAYTPRLLELKDRARTLTEKIMPFEDECERNNGLCAESHASIKAAVLDGGLQAINTPVEYGGAGLSVLEQVVVQDELGKLTNALWDCVWRPANPLAHATADQRERYLIPVPAASGAMPWPSPKPGGIGLLGREDHRHPRRRRWLRHQRREVVRHRRRCGRLPAGAGQRGTRDSPPPCS